MKVRFYCPLCQGDQKDGSVKSVTTSRDVEVVVVNCCFCFYNSTLYVPVGTVPKITIPPFEVPTIPPPWRI
jgi:hypothetical protein